MNFKTTLYANYEKTLPQAGKHILAQQTNEHILVYQAYRPSIANYAIEHQEFGGADYSYNRMSWIKPNFLWMMYRSGWAAKPGQEKIVGIWIKKTDFDIILENSAFTSYAQTSDMSHDDWKASLDENEIRLQWDPDHIPNGEKHTRKAIQLGIKGTLLKQFGKEMPVKIIDLSDFVNKQRAYAQSSPYEQLQVAEESIYLPKGNNLARKIGLDVRNL